jgi:uncharacterized protein (TIGR02271 family)
MAKNMIGRIHPGASVDWADGHLGQVTRVGAASIEVRAQDRGRTLVVPLELIRGVAADGSVQLSATQADLGRLTGAGSDVDVRAADGVETLELREEQLVPHKELEESGRVRVRKETEEVPRRLEVDAYYEEVEVEHVPIGRVVKEQESAREEDGVYIVPIYEEQLVVVKRLVLKEEIHVRRQGATEKRLFEETVRRERLVIEDVDRTGRVREQYATEQPEGERVAGDTLPSEETRPGEGGFLEKLGRKIVE